MLVGAVVFPLAGAAPADEPLRVETSRAMSAIVTKISPVYPPLAKQMNIAGRVEIQATIAEDGSVSATEAISGNPFLVRAAIDAIRKWKFKPFKDEGKSVKAVSTFTLEFKL
jgi:protein TonB